VAAMSFYNSYDNTRNFIYTTISTCITRVCDVIFLLVAFQFCNEDEKHKLKHSFTNLVLPMVFRLLFYYQIINNHVNH